MAKSDLKIKATSPQGKSITTSVTYVNPEATNDQLATLGTMVNALTDNSYDSSTKVTTVEVDVESDKQVPTFELFEGNLTTPLTNNQLNITKNTGNTFGFKSNSNGMIYVPCPGPQVDVFWRNAENSSGVKGFYIHTGTYYEVGDKADIVIKTEETENFKAGSVTLHITVTA